MPVILKNAFFMTSSYSLVSAPFQITQLEPLSSEAAL